MARDLELKWVDAIIAKDKWTCCLCIGKECQRQRERANGRSYAGQLFTLAGACAHEVVKSAVMLRTND